MGADALLKKLQFKDQGQAVLIINAPEAFREVMTLFKGQVHEEAGLAGYGLVLLFGTTNKELETRAPVVENRLADSGLLWICYPKKTSRRYKGSDCDRERVGGLLAGAGYEPVRQVAIDDDWSAIRFKKVEDIKKMVRNFAVTEEGKKRVKSKEKGD